MSLFNLILIRNLCLSKSCIDNISYMPVGTLISNNKAQKKSFSRFVNCHTFFISKQNNQIVTENISQNLANQRLKSGNTITQLINKYWQETIFLSVASPSFDKYANQLKSEGLVLDKSQYKKFLADFSKAIMNGRIVSSLQSSKSTITQVDIGLPVVKYTWRKGLNFDLSKKLPFMVNNQRYPNFPNKMQLTLTHQLKNNGFPVFSVINRFNQVVISEPSDELLAQKSLVDIIYQWYYSNFLWQKDRMPVYEGLFFINPADASEYMNYIKMKYNYSGNYNDLNIFAGSLDFYYKTTRTSPPKVQFRLIPDLKELGQLIYKYRYKKNLLFHNHQVYGRDYFQGQPIYFIQPVFAKNKYTKQIDLVRYLYFMNKNKSKKQYEAIFMNYDTAIMAWQQYRKQLSNYSLPLRPKIMVYNLEDFLRACEDNNQIEKKNILFIPSQETYQFIKHKKQYIIPQIISRKILSVKVLTTRIIWSLTSRQPMYW